MKFALIFLVSFVGLSAAERYIWPSPIAPRAHLMPLFYADGHPADNETPTEEKFLQLGSLLPSLPSLPSATPLFTITTTVVSTVVSTLSTPVTSKCIPAVQFSTSSPAAGAPIIQTAACARRRREVSDPAEGPIEPAQPLPLEVTAAEPLPADTNIQEVAVLPDPAMIQSSQAAEMNHNMVQQRNKFNINLTTTLTVIQPTTSYVFAPYVVKSSVTLAGAGGLLCLPSGYLVC